MCALHAFCALRAAPTASLRRSFRLADGALLGASLLTTKPRIRRGGRRFGRHQRSPTLSTCSVRFRDARSRVNDAPSVVQLRRCQRSFLGSIRERFHRRDDPVLTSRSDSSRRGGTRTRGSGSTRSTAVPSTPPTGVKPARNRAAAMGARALVWKGTHAPNFIARAINKSGERRVRRRGADQRLSPAHC